MLRPVKIAMIATVALWGFIGSFQNFFYWEATTGAVQAATSMATFEGGADSWQATSNPVVVTLGALFIALSKLTGALLCTLGVFRMFGARNLDAAEFQIAKRAALAGCGIMMIMLFGGFVVVAETWFSMWRSEEMREASLNLAFRYGGMITLIAIFVGMREE